MNVFKLVIPAVCYSLVAALTTTSLRAAEPASAGPADGKKSLEPTPAPAPPPPPGLLMTALGEAGLADPLTKAGINIYGYAQGGYFHDFSAPGSQGPTYIGYNNFKNTVILD